MEARPVKVCTDATLIFPLIASQTFLKDVESKKRTAVSAESVSESVSPVVSTMTGGMNTTTTTNGHTLGKRSGSNVYQCNDHDHDNTHFDTQHSTSSR